MMKKRGCCFSLILSAMAVVGLVSCGPEAPSKSATDSAGQAIVDSIKTPLDKSRQVGDKLEKAAERTDDAIKATEQ